MNKSIAFNREKINRLNSLLSKIGSKSLFFVKNYNPKSYNVNLRTSECFILLSVINLNSLFYDCTPWFFYAEKNRTGKDLSLVLQDITGIGFTEIKSKICTINKLRNSLCHNTTEENFRFITKCLNSAGIDCEVKKWNELILQESDLNLFIQYYITPFDDYIDSLINFFDKTAPSKLTYNEDTWITILKSAYVDQRFLEFNLPRILPSIYDYLSLDDGLNVVSNNKEVQIKRWIKRFLDKQSSELSVLITNYTFKIPMDPEIILFKAITDYLLQ